MEHSNTATEGQSTLGLLSKLGTIVPDIMRKEVQLLRAEVGESANQAVTALTLIIAGLMIALGALHVLLAALVTALTAAGIPAPWSALIVGIVVALIALACVAKGVSDLKASQLAPERTIRSVRKDAEAVEEAVK